MAVDYPCESHKLDESAIGWVASCGESLRVDEVFSDARFIDAIWYEHHGLQSYFLACQFFTTIARWR